MIELDTKDCYLKDWCHRYKQGKECETFCQKLFRIDTLYKNALLTDKQIRYKMRQLGTGKDSKLIKEKIIDLGNDRNALVSAIKNGQNFYIHSSGCGNGKTFWAIWLLKKYLNYIWADVDPDECHALFVSVPKFLIELKRNIGGHSDYADTIINSVLNADLVVWDEVGSKAGTEYEIENLLTIINDRINTGKSNIYTSNVDGDALRSLLGDRLYSRIISYSDDIEFQGKDLREVFKNIEKGVDD